MRLETLCENIATAVTALDASAYQHGGVDETWNESPIPLDPAFSPESVAHLCFSVLPRSSPPTEQRRSQPNDVIRCRSRVDVVFAYRLRPTEQLDDFRVSRRAALAIVKAVNHESAGWEAEDDVVVHVRETFRPTSVLEDPYLLVTTSFDIDHDEEV